MASGVGSVSGISDGQCRLCGGGAIRIGWGADLVFFLVGSLLIL